TTNHTLALVEEHVNAEANHTLDDLGIAKNAREEKFKARDAKLKQQAAHARALQRTRSRREASRKGHLRSARQHRWYQARSSGAGSQRTRLRRLEATSNQQLATSIEPAARVAGFVSLSSRA